MSNANPQAEHDKFEQLGEELANRLRQPEPSWFPEQRGSESFEALAERYRRRRPEPPAGDQQPYRNPLRTEMRLQRPTMPADRYQETERSYANRTPTALKLQGAGLRRTYFLATLTAITAGGTIGYAATQFEHIKATAHGFVAAITKPVDAVSSKSPSAGDGGTIVHKKLITTARLEVADASGVLNSYIPLALRAEPSADMKDLVLKISGLPETAYLTAGKRAADNSWQLTAAETKDLKLVIRETTRPEIDIAVAAFEARTGELAAPVKEMTVAINDPAVTIAPASAIPDTFTIKKASPAVESEAAAEGLNVAARQEAKPDTEVQDLLNNGNSLLKSGDIKMARLFFERAFAKGSAEGALGAGKTYDPVVFTDLKVQGIKPDASQAMDWYIKADAAGNEEAAAAIEALKAAQ